MPVSEDPHVECNQVWTQHLGHSGFFSEYLPLRPSTSSPECGIVPDTLPGVQGASGSGTPSCVWRIASTVACRRRTRKRNFLNSSCHTYTRENLKLHTRDLRCRHSSQAKVMGLRRLVRLATSGRLWLGDWDLSRAGPGKRGRGMLLAFDGAFVHQCNQMLQRTWSR